MTINKTEEYTNVIDLEDEQIDIKEPSKYKVVFVNDDYTPMDWVVELLEKYFDYSMENAINIMLQVHTTGKSVVGIYPKDIAETKSYIVNLISQEKGHPFKSVIEED